MDAPTRRFVIGLVTLLLLAPIAASSGAPFPIDGEAQVAVRSVVSEEPCPDSDFTCITMRMPRNHFAPAGGPTFDVTFGLLRATGGESRGAFVTVTGGPGSSGLAVADGYTAALDPRIPEEYDIVFFDQRGIGMSEPIQCPEAALAYYLITSSPEDPAAYAADAERFTQACVRESGVDPADLAYYSTTQAVEDLDVFLTWLGGEGVQLYGESYGTQFAQQYAAAHPGHLDGLFLDGPVDLTVSGFEYYEEQAAAFGHALEVTLGMCHAEPTCDADSGGGPLQAYDALAADLGDGPIPFEFVAAGGETEERELTLGLLESAAASSVYSTVDRMLLQRAVAYASRGDLLPMARLAYLALGQDPESLVAVGDETLSDAMYYAVECTDYVFPGSSKAERVAAFFEAAQAAGVADFRLGSVFFGDLPCAFWPARPLGEARPRALTSTRFPVWVLASTADPATPFVGALRIFERLSKGYLIVQEGGPHVIFGRGDPCPDDPVTDFLLSGDLPAERRIDCSVDPVDPYVPLPAPTVDDYADALEAMEAIDGEINNSADFWYWDGSGPLQLGCLFDGSIRYESTDRGYEVQLEGCEMTAGMPLTGDAVIDDEKGTFQLSATSPHGTDLEYTRDADGVLSVEGEFRGEPVSEAEPAA